MTNAYFLLSLIWVAIAAIEAVIIIGMLRSGRKDPTAGRPPYLTAGVMVLSAAAIPSAIQYSASDGQQFWAGAPLLVAALYLLARGLGVRAGDRPAAMSFREKSALVSGLAIIIVYGWASYELVQTPTLESAFGWLVGSTVLLIIITAISHATLALVRRPETADERDAIVGWRSSRNGYLVLGSAIWGIVALVFVGVAPALIVYASVGAFALAELTRLTSELLYYRLPL